jgi:hypothetical protein
VDKTKSILILPKNRDDAEILLLRKVDTRVEATFEFWNCGRSLVHDPEAVPLVDDANLEHAVLALADERLGKPA